MKRQMWVWVVCGFCAVTFLGCATAANNQWEETIKTDTIVAYEYFVMQYPRSGYVNEARGRLLAFYRITPTDTQALKDISLQDKKLGYYEASLISKLIIAGSALLGNNASWTDIGNGRTIYDFLKKAESHYLPFRPISLSHGLFSASKAKSQENSSSNSLCSEKPSGTSISSRSAISAPPLARSLRKPFGITSQNKTKKKKMKTEHLSFSANETKRVDFQSTLSSDTPHLSAEWFIFSA